ncbi:MAG: hypothetical protein DSY37_01815 [Hyperthermus sp.]|nr:MAG: hypothetical protein DSY37_01815 [Hyperthermus sp.]
MSLSAAEKERFLRALEEDREFRHAVMGLLGFREILERISRIEERQQELERRMVELAERQQRLEERVARLEERMVELEERMLKLEERVTRLEEAMVKLGERMARLEERMLEATRVVMVVAHRFGVVSEEAFRKALSYIVEETLGAALVRRWIHRDEEGLVYGHPSIVEADVVVRNGVHILVEIKSRVSRADVAELYRVGRLYERVEGVRPRLLIVGGFIDSNAAELAQRLGVELVPVTSLHS